MSYKEAYTVCAEHEMADDGDDAILDALKYLNCTGICGTKLVLSGSGRRVNIFCRSDLGTTYAQLSGHIHAIQGLKNVSVDLLLEEEEIEARKACMLLECDYTYKIEERPPSDDGATKKRKAAAAAVPDDATKKRKAAADDESDETEEQARDRRNLEEERARWVTTFKYYQEHFGFTDEQLNNAFPPSLRGL